MKSVTWRRRFLLVGPAGILMAGMVAAAWVQPSGRMSLEVPLSEFPSAVEGYELERELEIPEGQLDVLRPDDYLLRRYARSDGGAPEGADDTPNEGPAGEAAGFELFVAYYGKQLGGSTIHSPRNCLPGGGWEPVEHRRERLETERYDGTVNRYVIQNREGDRALVYYWYQGRGRIAANEYRVKWDLLRDAVVKRRTDEALVRLVFPLAEDAAGHGEARELVGSVADALARHLPAG